MKLGKTIPVVLPTEHCPSIREMEGESVGIGDRCEGDMELDDRGGAHFGKMVADLAWVLIGGVRWPGGARTMGRLSKSSVTAG